MTQTIFPTIDLKATGENIVRLRKANGFTVRELQHYFGFEEPQAIYKWQQGKSLPSIDNLFALSRLFGVSMNEILIQSQLNLINNGQSDDCPFHFRGSLYCFYVLFVTFDPAVDQLLQTIQTLQKAGLDAASQCPGKHPATHKITKLPIHFAAFTCYIIARQKPLFLKIVNPLLSETVGSLACDKLAKVVIRKSKGMMSKGLFKKDDPELLATEVTAPVALWIAKADRQPQCAQENMENIERHIRHFCDVYMSE